LCAIIKNIENVCKKKCTANANMREGNDTKRRSMWYDKYLQTCRDLQLHWKGHQIEAIPIELIDRRAPQITLQSPAAVENKLGCACSHSPQQKFLEVINVTQHKAPQTVSIIRVIYFKIKYLLGLGTLLPCCSKPLHVLDKKI
jgi:hypothetical protein